MHTLQVDNLSAGYGDALVLENVSFTIRPGEMVALLGPNGSGKTTLLKALAGHIPLTHGVILLDGIPIEKTPPFDRPIVFVSKKALVPWLSLRGNIVLEARSCFAREESIPREELNKKVQRRVADMLELFHIPEQFQDMPVGHLSEGYQQRAALATTFAVVPEKSIVLLDEPTANIDWLSQEELLDFLPRYFAKCQASVVVSLHDWKDAERICGSEAEALLLLPNANCRFLPLHELLRTPRATVLLWYGEEVMREHRHSMHSTSRANRLAPLIGEDPPLWRGLLYAVALVLLFLCLLEAGGTFFATFFERHNLPLVSDVGRELWRLATIGLETASGRFLGLPELFVLSSLRIVPGVIVGMPIGWALAIWLSLRPQLRIFSTALVLFLYCLSILSIYLLFVSWFGLDYWSKAVLSVWVGFKLQFILVYWRMSRLLYARSSLDERAEALFERYNANRASRCAVWQLLFRLTLDQALYAFGLAMALGWSISVVTEPGGIYPYGIAYLVENGRAHGGLALQWAGIILLVCATGVWLWLSVFLARMFRKNK